MIKNRWWGTPKVRNRAAQKELKPQGGESNPGMNVTSGTRNAAAAS